jgi:hypothetical protein
VPDAGAYTAHINAHAHAASLLACSNTGRRASGVTVGSLSAAKLSPGDRITERFSSVLILLSARFQTQHQEARLSLGIERV